MARMRREFGTADSLRVLISDMGFVVRDYADNAFALEMI